MSENIEEREVRPYEESLNSQFQNGKDLPLVYHVVVDKDLQYSLPMDDQVLAWQILLEITSLFLANFVSDKEDADCHADELLKTYKDIPMMGLLKVMPLQSYNPHLITCFKIKYIPSDYVLALEEFIQYPEDSIPDRVLDLINEQEENTREIFKKYGEMPKKD